jgi:hypothetical protein
MYNLTLTHDERMAIQFVGHRYSNGDDLYLLLWANSRIQPDDEDWDAPCDLTFTFPEHIAWQISENAEREEGRFPLFRPSLVAKMEEFLATIV